MNLKHLRHAVGLADFGNFTAAADRLAISQPALSRSIQALEQELGLPLFARGPGGVALTEAGLELIAQARIILSQASNLQQAAWQLSKGEAGRVRIGLGPMFSRLVDPMLAACWAPGRAVDLQVHVLPVERLVAGLLAGEIDFFIADARAAASHPAIAVELIGESSTGYFVRPSHPLAGMKGTTVEDLRGFPRATPNLPRTRLESDEAIQAAAAAPAGSFCCENLEFLIRFTRSSDAILLAMEGAIAEELRSAELVALDIPELDGWRARIGLASLAGREQSVLAARYSDCFRALLDNTWIAS